MGANIPIGGPVSVGMNKTITAPAPKQTSQTSQTSQTQPPPPQTPVIAEKPDDQQASTSPD